MRFTKNQSRRAAKPRFTDQDMLTTYLFSMVMERRLKIKDIYDYIYHHWLKWFPDLSSYSAYNARLNRLAAVFPILASRLTVRYGVVFNEQDLISLTLCPLLPVAASERAK